MLTTIYLHGYLGRKFGKKWELDVSSVKEALQAIDINLKGELVNYWLNKGREKKYRVKIGDYAINDEKELVGATGSANHIHVVPVIKGSEDGLGKILAGVGLIAAIWLTGGFAAGGWAMASSGGGLGIIGSSLVGMGASLILGGVVQLLTPVPNFNQDAGAEERGSTIFAGNASTIAQGGSVGLVYGRMLVSPMPISIALSNSDVSITTSGESDGVTEVDLNGGGGQYVTNRD